MTDAEPSHAIRNFRIAAGLETGDFYGFVFQDSDVAKWLEAAAYTLAQHPDDVLEKTADDVISLLKEAQAPNGYLDTYFMIREPGSEFFNLRDGHELYCAGHLSCGSAGIPVEKGYALLHGEFAAGDEIEVHFSMPPVFMRANGEVRADAGRAALKKGPLVYCLEQQDNGENLEQLMVDTTKPVREKYDDTVLGETGCPVK